MALDPNPIRPYGEGAEDVTTRLDAEHNRMYLDLVLYADYPAQARPAMLPADALIRDGTWR
jgi:hypothetical protein